MSHGRRKPRQPRWPASPMTLESTCRKVKTFDKEEAAELSNEARIAWLNLKHGTGTTTHFDTLATALNSRFSDVRAYWPRGCRCGDKS